jgi:hypothetical protein
MGGIILLILFLLFNFVTTNMCHNNNGDKVHHNNPRVKNGVVSGLMCLRNKIETL